MNSAPTLPAPDPAEPAAGPALQGESDGWIGARAPRAREIAARLLTLPGLLRRHRDLIGTSVKRELEARFQGTILGWFWPLFHPLFLFAVYYFIFAHLLGLKMPGLPPEKEAAMGIFMFVGILVWAAFAETLTRGTNAIVDNGNLIKKLAFPSEILPLNLTLVGLVTMGFGVAVFVVACFVTPIWPAPGLELCWIPAIVLLQGLFTFGLALFLSTLHVFLRDTLQVVTVLTTVWMFVTPIFWSPEAMSQEVAAYKPLLAYNPMYHLVQAWRGVLMGDLYIEPGEYASGGYVSSVAAIGHHLSVFGLWGLGALVVGFTFFVLSQRRFADEV